MNVRRSAKWAGTAAVAALWIGSACADEHLLRQAHGDVPVLIDWPAGPGPHPAVVLAPGQGYHMRLPLLEQTSQALVRQGVAVFRFDWAYMGPAVKGRPSADLSHELSDLQAVVTLARKSQDVDAARVAVGGKSLGSVVAWRAFLADPALRAAIMITPICSRVPPGHTAPRSEADENYPGFAAQGRPILWLAGDQDPLCAPTPLMHFVATGAGRARLAIVGGDHSLEDPQRPPSAAASALARHVLAAAVVTASFAADAFDLAGSVPSQR